MFFHALSFTQMKTLYLPYQQHYFVLNFFIGPILSLIRTERCHGEKKFTLLQTFCLRIVLKYRIEVSKAPDLFTFILIGFILRKIKVVVVVDDENSEQSPEGGYGGEEET